MSFPNIPVGMGWPFVDAATGEFVSTAVKNWLPSSVSMLGMGAAADGATDDWAVFVAARTKAGAEGVVHFPAKKGATVTTYYFAGTRPDMSGTQISADPSVVIKVDENPNIKTLRLLTPVTIENPVHGTTLRKPGAVDLPLAAVMASPTRDESNLRVTAEDLTTWTPVGATLGAGNALAYTTPANQVVAANQVSWSGTMGSNVFEGVYKVPQVGVLYEATIRDAATTTGGTNGILLANEAGKWVWHQVRSGKATPTFSIGTTGFVDTGAAGTYDVPNGDAYKLDNAATVGVLFHSLRSVSFYINGLRVHDVTFIADVTRIGLMVNTGHVGTTTITDAVSYRGFTPAATRPVVCSIVGDSILYGAWSPITAGDLLPAAFAALPGGGDVVVRANFAQPGTSASQWGTPGDPYDIANRDFTADDYVLVMLGTNDVQGGRTPAQFETNLEYIGDEIVSQGAVPIFGVFPTFTVASVSGVTGVATTNYTRAASLRARLVRWAAASGYELAQVNDAFGANIGWYGDNIHPRAVGQAAIARSFAQAIARAQTRRAGPLV